MSSLIVEVCRIDEIVSHDNSDNLEIAVVKGWRCIVQKGKHQVGDKVVYFPVDTVLPVELSDRLGVTKYLSKGRLRAAKLRGVISCGLVIECEDPSWEVGQNVVDHYGVEKWEPPEVHDAGDAERDHAMFLRYTDIENIRNFPDVLIDGELMAGSHNQRRKRPEDLSKSLYWMPLTDPAVQAFFEYAKECGENVVILYGEIFGDGVQDLKYGMERGQKVFRAFDMVIGDQFVNYDVFLQICEKTGVPSVPKLHRGPWSPSLLNFAGGKSMLAPEQIREGIVIKPAQERWNDNVGRVILKCISDEYLVRKGGSEKH